jgi:hypothetical protein
LSGTFVQRAIDITITLGTGTLGSSGMNTVKLSGLRVICTISKAGSPSYDQSEIRIFGLPPSVMNAVSTLGVPFPLFRLNNAVTVEAGDAVNGMAVVFNGLIMSAWQNLDAAPDTFLSIQAFGTTGQAEAAMAPTSFPGTADVATIMSGLADRMGMAFENNGVQVQLSNPYLVGSLRKQAESVARAAGIEMCFDSTASVPILAIWPKMRTRGSAIPLINAQSGLIGYPRFNDRGVSFRCLFNPSIRVGGQIQLQSQIGGAPASSGATVQQVQQAGPNGTWVVYGPLTYSLSAQEPDGPWFCDATCYRVLASVGQQ